MAGQDSARSRRRLAVALTSAGAVTAALTLAAPHTQAAVAPSAIEAIDGWVEDERRDRRVPGFAYAIVDGTQVVHVRGFGEADGSGRPVSGRTPFVLGSTSKSLTALAVIQLVDAGKVSLEDRLSRWIPELRLADDAQSRVTVRQLLNQTSGLPAGAGGKLLRSVGDGTSAEVLAELQGARLHSEPGQSFAYANANYVLLGLVIERASGLAYGRYVRERIFEPLGMRDSYVSTEAAARVGLATGHRYWFGFPLAHGPTAPDGVRAAGYLISSAADMARYLTLFLNGGVVDGRRLVSERGLRTLLEPVAAATLGGWSGHQTSRYAMGWYVGGPWREPAILHLGGTPDSSSMIVLLPGRGQAVVALANANLELPLPGADGATDRIAAGIVSLLASEEPDAGFSLRWFYVAFDAVAALLLAAIALAAVRLLRDRAAPLSGRRRRLRVGRGLLEGALGAALLTGPVATGQGYAGALLWTPDLALVLLTVGGLLAPLGLARVVATLTGPRGTSADDRGSIPLRAAPRSSRPGFRPPRRPSGRRDERRPRAGARQ